MEGRNIVLVVAGLLACFAFSSMVQGIPIKDIYEKDLAWCKTAGDPHYRTFDDKRYMFRGKCKYVLAKDEHNTFEVIQDNGPCKGRKVAACTNGISIRINTIAGKGVINIRMMRGTGRCMVNNIQVSIPYSAPGIALFFNNEGKKQGLKVVSDVGLVVRYDGMYDVYVKVIKYFFGKMKGLCGNYNGKVEDDWTKPDGKKASSIAEFGNSWKVSQSCPNVPAKPPAPTCKGIHAATATKCDTFLKGAPFLSCHATVSPSETIDNCKYDVCTCPDTPLTCLCMALLSYDNQCYNYNIVLGPWYNLPRFRECKALLPHW